VPKKAEFDSEGLYFDEFNERCFELAAKIQTDKLPRRRFLARGWFSISVVAKLALIYFGTREIVKMLHNVYKGSCIGKYPLRKPFTVDLPC
jgi:hypothetical protein